MGPAASRQVIAHSSGITKGHQGASSSVWVSL
jgi:hypothetical protein